MKPVTIFEFIQPRPIIHASTHVIPAAPPAFLDCLVNIPQIIFDKGDALLVLDLTAGIYKACFIFDSHAVF